MSRTIVCLLFLLAGCSLPLGNFPKQTVTLRLNASGPTLNDGGTGRLVTPDATHLELTVVSGGKVISQTTVAWTPGGISASALVKNIPLGVPVTINATAFSLEGTTKNVNALGSTSLTLTTGVNTVSLFLFPSDAITAQPLTLDDLTDLSLPGTEWTLYQFTTAANHATATVIVPTGLAVYLQAPSGTTIPVYKTELTVASVPGTWRLLVWNQTSETVTGSLGVRGNFRSTPDVDYTVADLTLNVSRGGQNYELLLDDRPFGAAGTPVTLQTRSFTPPTAGSYSITGLNWNVGSQMGMRRWIPANPGFQVYFYDLAPPTTANEVRHLYAYEAVVEEDPAATVESMPLYLLDFALPLVSNLQVDADGHVTWDGPPPMAGAELVGYVVSDSESGGVTLEGTSNTATDIALPVGTSDVTVQGIYELDAWPDIRLAAHGGVPKAVTVVDAADPMVTLEIDAPLPYVLPDDVVEINGTVTDNDYKIGQVVPQYRLNNGPLTDVTDWNGTHFSIKLPSFQKEARYGVQTVSVSVQDPSGNVGESSVNFTTVKDTTVPVITVQTNPLSFSKATGLTVIGIVQEAGGVATVEASTSWNAGAVTPTYLPATGQWWVVIGTPGMAAASEGTGSESIELTVTNYAGLEQTQLITLNISP